MRKPKYHIISFICLLVAFLISATYQYYRSNINEIQQWDAFGIREKIIYLLLIAISCLLLLNKSVVLKFMIGFCVVGCIISFTFYLPVILPQRTIGWVDVAESILYIGLLLLSIRYSLKALKQLRLTEI